MLDGFSAEKLQDGGGLSVMDLDVINSTIGMEVEIHFNRAGNPGTILDLFAPRDANCSEETSIVIAITRQSYIE